MGYRGWKMLKDAHEATERDKIALARAKAEKSRRESELEAIAQNKKRYEERRYEIEQETEKNDKRSLIENKLDDYINNNPKIREFFDKLEECIKKQVEEDILRVTNDAERISSEFEEEIQSVIKIGKSLEPNITVTDEKCYYFSGPNGVNTGINPSQRKIGRSFNGEEITKETFDDFEKYEIWNADNQDLEQQISSLKESIDKEKKKKSIFFKKKQQDKIKIMVEKLKSLENKRLEGQKLKESYDKLIKFSPEERDKINKYLTAAENCISRSSEWSHKDYEATSQAPKHDYKRGDYYSLDVIKQIIIKNLNNGTFSNDQIDSISVLPQDLEQLMKDYIEENGRIWYEGEGAIHSFYQGLVEDKILTEKQQKEKSL